MSIMISAFHVALIVFLLWRFAPSQLRFVFWISAGFKLACGVAIGWLYFRYYGGVGDTVHFFSAGSSLAEFARTDFGQYLAFMWTSIPTDGLWHIPSEPRTLFFIKLTSILCLATLDNYWIISCYFSLIGFCAAWHLVVRLRHYLPETSAEAALAFLFLPSAVFWTSGLIKESIASAALYYIVALFLAAWFDGKLRAFHGIAGLMAVWLLWNLKYHYAAILMPVLVASVLYRYFWAPVFRVRPMLIHLAGWGLIFSLLLLITTTLHPNFHPAEFLRVIVENNQSYERFSEPGDLIYFDALQPNVKSVLRHAPKALGSGLFRPLPWEATNVLQGVASIENLIVLLFAIIAARYAGGASAGKHTVLVLAVSVYIVLLCILLTLSTPNFGTLSRYRAGFFPFFVFLTLCLIPAVNRISNRLVR